ncbi:MAG TPA: LuxR C-terminal-related transcriptional regulator [Mycobacterium sp.]|nr:LuxR C-terminal-related transcriptional regulator [Mycobacterium sp.]HUH71809.1 LuxR C-terminal-related transcriptional regulator [Mycobacterium sp.]
MAIQWHIVQRGASLGLLDSTLKRDRLGAVLVGPAGVGKTVLVRSVVERFAQRHATTTVRWLAGTVSASQVPFGVFSHLVDVAGVGDSTTLLRTARASLLQHSGDGLLLVVDDAHHLDNLSATLVHQLTLTRSVRQIVTVHEGESAPDAITALWKDGLLTRVDIEPFDQAQTRDLLAAVLGGPLETSSAERIFQVSEGNPLYLRHLVEGAVNSGALRQVEGVWQLRGEMSWTPQLSSLVREHLRSLPPPVKSVLKYLAIEEPLTLMELSALTGRKAIEQAEDLDIVEVADGGDGLVVRSAHPLYTEQVRASLGRIATRRLRTLLVAQLSSRPATNVSARLRLAALAIDSDTPPPVDDTVASSYEAMRLGDLELGERLARSALERSGGLAARVPLAHALAWLGRGRDADDVLEPVDPDQLSEWELTAWAVPKAANRFWMLNEPRQATDFLHAMRARVTDPAALTIMDALAAMFVMYVGKPEQAVTTALGVLASSCAQDIAVAWAAATVTLSSARLGRFSEVAPLAERGLAAQHPGLLRFTIGLGEITTSLMTESVMHAQCLARHYMEFSEHQQPGRSIAEVLLARTLMASGEFAEATLLLREAAAALARTGYSWGPLALIYLTQALGQQGESAAAAEMLARAESHHGMNTELYAPELALARAWRLAAARDMDGALAAARDAAHIAERSGQLAVALHALHEAVRLGDTDAADAIARVTDKVDCVAGRLALAHGRALAAGDAAALDAVARELAELGMTCAAADASAQAALAYACRHDRKHELQSRARAAELQGGASTPALEQVLSPLPLTGREREIAIMVADGLSNKAIAERLCVSVRTVEGHIYRACIKLDVADRTMLAHTVAAAKSGSGLRATAAP